MTLVLGFPWAKVPDSVKGKRFVYDLDGTLCHTKTPDMDYSQCMPIMAAIKVLRAIHAKGGYIIIHTARNMVTQQANVGKVVANIGKTTIEWLDRYGVPYHEIYFGKPYGDYYIDDKAVGASTIQVLKAINE